MMEANLLYAALAGLIGAIILTILIYLLQFEHQNVDIPYLLGSWFVDIQHKSKIYTVGIILHLLAGIGWGMLYVALLTGLAITINWPAGILWGFAHGVFVGILIGTFSESHPYIGEGKPIADPGMMGRNWGNLIPYWILALHVIFGVTTLTVYHQLVS